MPRRLAFRPSRGLTSAIPRRSWLHRFLIAATALSIWLPAPALAAASSAAVTPASGGASVSRPPTHSVAKPPKRPATKKPTRRSTVAVAQVQNAPFSGRGMWIWDVAQSSAGSPSAIVARARSYGISVVMIKSGDGTSTWSQFNPQLVAAMHAGGLHVCAWQYVYGDHPVYEAEVGAAAVRNGADCLLIDAESEYEGKYLQAQEYITTLRRLIGSSFPVGLAGFPYIDYHPAFPYSVFLGAGGAQYNVPQMYWSEIGTSVAAVYTHTYNFNQLYQRPIEVIGEVADGPPPAQVVQFRQTSLAYGASLVSWWDWQGASSTEWQAVAQHLPSPQGPAPPTTLPLLTVSSGGGISAGDLVVWAQEHLLEAGEPMQIDGQFGSQTQTAVQQFQAAHGIPVSGEIDPATWQALLRYPRPTVTWTSQKGTTTASVASMIARGASSPVPLSASLPATGYEIPKDLGAGKQPRHPHR